MQEWIDLQHACKGADIDDLSARTRLPKEHPLKPVQTALKALERVLCDPHERLFLNAGQDLMVIVGEHLDRAARIFFIHDDPASITAWHKSRCVPFQDTPWDRARRTRLLRAYGGQGSLSPIDPGCVWLVEWLEHHGFVPMYSCEGHPMGAYFVLEACPKSQAFLQWLSQQQRDDGTCPWCFEDRNSFQYPIYLQNSGEEDRRTLWRWTCDTLSHWRP